MDDKSYQEELDGRAIEATDGNVTAFDALAHELAEAVKPFDVI